MKFSTHEIAAIGLLAALTLVLSYIETLIPLPVTVPGIKLGLANIAIMFALYMLDTKTAFFLVIIKILAAGFLFGSPFMMVFSLSGSMLAFLGMWLLKKSGKFGVVVVAVVSAILHNVGQLAAVAVVLSAAVALINLPVLIVAAIITGGITGGVTAAVMKAVGPSMHGSRQGVILEASADSATPDSAALAASSDSATSEGSASPAISADFAAPATVAASEGSATSADSAAPATSVPLTTPADSGGNGAHDA